MKLAWVLSIVFSFFMIVLILTYAIARQSNPIFLDQHGRPTNAASSK